jgi:hypothetical protein
MPRAALHCPRAWECQRVDTETIEKTEPLPRLTPGEIPHYSYHPLSNRFPMMPEGELAALTTDVGLRGLLEPITILEDQILDGRNRYEACLRAGVEPRFVEYKGDDPAAFVISSNILRRHLSQAQKDQIIRNLLADRHERSDRDIAKVVGVDHKTVGAKRSKMVAHGDIPDVDRRADSKGRSYPVRKKGSAKRPPAGFGSGRTAARARRETDAVLAFADLLNEGDINDHLEKLLSLLAGDIEERIKALPEFRRVILARGFLALLDISVDDLRPVAGTTGPLFPGLPHDPPQDDNPEGDEEAPSESVIAPATPPGTLH